MTVGKLCWLDVRAAGSGLSAILEEAVHQRIDGIVASDAALLEGLPPFVRRIVVVEGPAEAANLV
ncbi:MAG: 3-dehydroquinate synthase II family protein, partial [Pseudonocardia sp.]|nr:3-dehydroquinate synthase II family protein [Pseudonocardia sp.]